MEHKEYLIDLLDESQQIIGQKKRKDIDKKQDIVHTVLVLGMTEQGKYMISKLPQAEGFWQGGKLAATIATMRRHKETAQEAAHRAIRAELEGEETALECVVEELWFEHEGVKRLLSVFLAKGIRHVNFEPNNIDHVIFLTKEEIMAQKQEKGDAFAPTFLAVWKEIAL